MKSTTHMGFPAARLSVCEARSHATFEYAFDQRLGSEPVIYSACSYICTQTASMACRLYV